jgi:hypothetical protein
MVLQVLADAAALVYGGDAVLLQQLARANPRELQDLRRANAAEGEDRLDARLGERLLAAADRTRSRSRACRRAARASLARRS